MKFKTHHFRTHVSGAGSRREKKQLALITYKLLMYGIIEERPDITYAEQFNMWIGEGDVEPRRVDERHGPAEEGHTRCLRPVPGNDRAVEERENQTDDSYGSAGETELYW